MTVQISVVVPTFKRPHMLNRCLTALYEQDFPSDEYEIIVVDDSEQGEAKQTVEWWQQRSDHQNLAKITYVQVKRNNGPAAARNFGWRHAQGSIIAFTDDDCVPTPSWLSSGITAFDEHLSALYGKIVMPLPPNPTDYELDASRLQYAGFVTANCFVRREALEAQGGFDENFTAAWREDSDLLFSLLENNRMVGHATDAVVVHPIRPAQWGVSIRQQRKVLFDALLYKKHPRLYRKRVRAIPPLHYYVICLSLLLTVFAVWKNLPALAIISASLWGSLTIRFMWGRLRETSHRFDHISEMVVTSILIPPLAIFWRIFGAFKFRVMFL